MSVDNDTSKNNQWFHNDIMDRFRRFLERRAEEKTIERHQQEVNELRQDLKDLILDPFHRFASYAYLAFQEAEEEARFQIVELEDKNGQVPSDQELKSTLFLKMVASERGFTFAICEIDFHDTDAFSTDDLNFDAIMENNGSMLDWEFSADGKLEIYDHSEELAPMTIIEAYQHTLEWVISQAPKTSHDLIQKLRQHKSIIKNSLNEAQAAQDSLVCLEEKEAVSKENTPKTRPPQKRNPRLKFRF